MTTFCCLQGSVQLIFTAGLTGSTSASYVLTYFYEMEWQQDEQVLCNAARFQSEGFTIEQTSSLSNLVGTTFDSSATDSIQTGSNAVGLGKHVITYLFTHYITFIMYLG